jgi:hypothetical protein
MATLQEIIERPDEVFNQGENPFNYIFAQGDYNFPRDNTIKLNNKLDSFIGQSRKNEGQLYFVTKLDYVIELEITTNRNGYFQGIERNVGESIFQEFGITTSRGGGKSQMNVTLYGGSALAFHVGGQGTREWGQQIPTPNFGDDYFTQEIQRRGINDPTIITDGFLLSLTSQYDASTYSIAANDPDRDTEITLVGFRQITPEEAERGGVSTVGDAVQDSGTNIGGSTIQDSNYEVIESTRGIDVDGFSYSILLAFDENGYFTIVDGKKSIYYDNEEDARSQYERDVIKRQEEAETSDKDDITDDLPPALDILKGEIQGLNVNIALIGGLIIVGIVVLIAVNAFAKGAGQGAVKSVKDSTAPSSGEGSSE